jgi:hypothetical protein
VRHVRAGTPIPPAILDAWTQCQPQGYRVCLDFPQAAAVRRWSAESKGKARQRRMVKRIEQAAPLIANELIARELRERSGYFNGN